MKFKNKWTRLTRALVLSAQSAEHIVEVFISWHFGCAYFGLVERKPSTACELKLNEFFLMTTI